MKIVNRAYHGKRHNGKWYGGNSLAVICACLLPLFGFGVASLIHTPPAVSETEKRALRQKPALTASALFSGEYTRGLSEYYSDAFPLRETLMALSAKINAFYFFQGGAQDGGLMIIERGQDDVGAGESILNVSGQESGGGGGSPAVTASPSPAVMAPGAASPVSASPASASPASAPPAVTPATPEPTPTAIPAPPPTPAVYPSKAEAQVAGNVVVFGTRAMEIVYAKPDIMERYAAAVNALAASAPDTQTILLIAPNSGEFYSSEEMHTGSSSQKALIDSVYGKLDENVIPIDAYQKLQNRTDEYIYFRTDHHWTALGAYYAYTAFCERMGLDAVPLDHFETGVYEDFVGSMYNFTAKYPVSKALKDNPDTLVYYFPVADTEMTLYPDGPAMKNPVSFPVINTKLGGYSNKYICFIGGDNELTHIETSVKNGQSILVVKESFANAFVPFLTSHYEHIWVIDPRRLNGNGQPAFNLAEFTSKHGINQTLYLNYPYMAISKAYCGYLEKMK